MKISRILEELVKVCEEEEVALIVGVYDGETHTTAMGGEVGRLSLLFLILQQRLLLEELTASSPTSPATSETPSF